LKPENILLENKNSNRIKIIDLGLSQINKDNHALKAERGSIYYVAPEMIQKNYNHKVDIWAAGVIFYVLLTGKPPFHATRTNSHGQVVLDNQMIKQLILKGQVDYSLSIFQKIGPMVVNILKAMLNMDPQRRPEAVQLLELPFFKLKEDSKINTQGRSNEGGNLSTRGSLHEHLSDEPGIISQKRNRHVLRELL
jgi:calcium-dependent protein kinase